MVQAGTRSNDRRKIFAGRYAYVKPLGRGAGGAVYLCEDLQSNLRQVAVKVLSAEAFATVQGKMLRREFEILSKLRHPNLVRVDDYGSLPDGGVFLAEEYIDGFSLQDARALIQPEGLIDLTLQLLHGLSYLHGMGMIHRDIKPANVMLLWLDDAKARPMAKLVDFGLSSADPKRDTLRGGTRSYMAPEIIRGEKGEFRSDLYSLGVTLYYAMCGVLPFGPRTKEDPPTSEEDFRPPEPHRLNPEVPLNLSRFTMVLLRQVADIEYADAGEALQGLAKDTESLEWVTTGRLANSLDLAAPPVLRGYFERGILVREAGNRDTIVDKLLAEKSTGRMRLIRGVSDGVGKSRLVREVVAAIKLGGRVVVRVDCREGMHPFGVLSETLAQLIEIAESRSLKIGERIKPNLNMLRRLGPWIGSGQSKEEREADFAWIKESFEDLAVVLHPDRVVIFLEDLHLGDSQSILFFKQWFDEHNAAHRPSVVVTSVAGRETDSLTTCMDADTIDVKGLQAEDVEYFFETRLGVKNLPNEWIQKVATASKGNPSYVEELSRHLIDNGILSRQSSISWEIDVDELVGFQLPRGPRESFRRRLSAFGHTGRETLELMALLGRPVEWSVLRKLLMARGEKGEDADRTIEMLQWRHFLDLDLDAAGRFVRLIDPVLESVIIDPMNPEWRRSLHRRIGERLQKHWLRGEADAEEVAKHMVDGGHARAVTMLEISADARALKDPAGAAGAYEKILEIETGPSTALVRVKLAEIAVRSNEPEMAIEHLNHAWSYAERTALEWLMHRVCLAGADTCFALGRPSDAREWLNRLHDTLPVMSQQANSLLVDARILILEGRLDEAQKKLNSSLARLEHFGNVSSRVRAKALLGRIQFLRGQIDEATSSFVEAIGLGRARETQEAVGRALLGFGVLLQSTGELEQAQRILLESFEVLSEYGGVDQCAEALVELGRALMQAGELEKARQRGLEAARLAEGLGHFIDYRRARMLVAELDIREVRGVEEAVQQVTIAAEEIVSSEESAPASARALKELSDALNKAGRRDEGAAALQRAQKIAESAGIAI